MAELSYRSLGSEGTEYPDWLTQLKKASGVYVIRDIPTDRVLYVGSSAGQLYGTITRHFQQWKRDKKWWSGAYGAGHDPGMTYRRGRVTVAVKITARGAHLAEEGRLIERLSPRDNLVEHPDGSEDAPF
jgi:hypothetical protein